MKPYLIEWLPFYGLYKYQKRYFNADMRTAKEAEKIQLFSIYHLAIAAIFSYGLLNFLINIHH